MHELGVLSYAVKTEEGVDEVAEWILESVKEWTKG